MRDEAIHEGADFWQAAATGGPQDRHDAFPALLPFEDGNQRPATQCIAIEETYTALVAALGERRIAYVHVMDQSGFDMGDAKSESVSAKIHRLLRVFRKIMPATAIILAGGMTRERADGLIADGTIDLADFGQPFIPTPIW